MQLVRPTAYPRRTAFETTAAQARLAFDEGLRTIRLAPLEAATPDTAAVQRATELTDQGRSVLIYKTPK
ncbi:MAG: hypothetical protein WKG07_08435 [Hymenobacter sp.]